VAVESRPGETVLFSELTKRLSRFQAGVDGLGRGVRADRASPCHVLMIAGVGCTCPVCIWNAYNQVMARAIAVGREPAKNSGPTCLNCPATGRPKRG